MFMWLHTVSIHPIIDIYVVRHRIDTSHYRCLCGYTLYQYIPLSIVGSGGRVRVASLQSVLFAFFSTKSFPIWILMRNANTSVRRNFIPCMFTWKYGNAYFCQIYRRGMMDRGSEVSELVYVLQLFPLRLQA
jgi:hypothetical protein